MSGWEKYVEQAAEPLDPAAFDRSDPQHDHWALDLRRGIARDRVRRILAAVGPLIQEDTRERMVTAAAASLDRDGEDEHWEATVVPCEVCKARADDWPAWIDPEDGFNYSTGEFTGLRRDQP